MSFERPDPYPFPMSRGQLVAWAIIRRLFLLAILIAILRSHLEVYQRIVVSLLILLSCQIQNLRLVLEKSTLKGHLAIDRQFERIRQLLSDAELEPFTATVNLYDGKIEELSGDQFIQNASTGLFAVIAFGFLLFSIMG